ncbi:hypothetical protein B0H13DRAFT_2394620 [Mycena leptocephala]|nr:hypothetical protein B0H13DRAFT_2394620 [Mycena leptocephala]
MHMFPSISFVIGLALTVNIRMLLPSLVPVPPTDRENLTSTSSVSAQNTTSQMKFATQPASSASEPLAGRLPRVVLGRGRAGIRTVPRLSSLNNNPGREISAYQSILNELVDECNSSGYPVKSAKVAARTRLGPESLAPTRRLDLR